jgi:hypothetical protein
MDHLVGVIRHCNTLASSRLVMARESGPSSIRRGRGDQRIVRMSGRGIAEPADATTR